MLRAFEATWEQAGHRVAPLLDGVAAAAVLGDDPVATRAVALGLARAQAMHRRVFLGDLLGDEGDGLPDDGAGISDMVRYGISIGRAARTTDDSPNLFTLHGGTESPLAEDVLTSPRWRALSRQVHGAGAILLISAPSRVPSLGALVEQFDGVVLVGDAARPGGVTVLADVQTAATMRTPTVAARPVAPRVERRSARWPWVALAAALAAGVLAIPQVREPLLRAAGLASPASVAPGVDSSGGQLPVVPPRVTSDAAWSTELRFLNSRADAQAAVLALHDSVPAATFADVRTSADSTAWYRILAGAFSDSISAENFLAALRTSGTTLGSAGAVTHVPFALLVDSASDNAMARLRVTGYQGRGLPAYTLRDSTGVWHIYVGAFTDGAAAAWFARQLDSLNIQSVLAVRTGSTS
ncbi:MAG: SPOR domain-containing protein [Gemmatimonadaceae bacterium]|nr:SPOR domain-containing protein [Gemmatimonadaceae bacterium]